MFYFRSSFVFFFRYDGIYKVCKYWMEKGKSGFKVLRYLIRRDDPVPAPWTKEGKKRIENLGLTMQVIIYLPHYLFHLSVSYFHFGVIWKMLLDRALIFFYSPH